MPRRVEERSPRRPTPRRLPSLPVGNPVAGARHLIGLLTPAIRKAEAAGLQEALLYLLEARAAAERIVAAGAPRGE